MSNWILTAAEKWCLPVVEKMHELLLTSSVIHADETRIQGLHEDGRDATAESKMWVYCNGKMNDRSIVIFDYQPEKARMRRRFCKDSPAIWYGMDTVGIIR